MSSKTISSLQEQIQELEQRCNEAEEALDAIRRGEVDALVISSDEGEKIYTFQGAESTYRLLVESINEGAATLIEDGTILYCNRRFAEMLKHPMESLIGSSIYRYILPEYQAVFASLLLLGMSRNCRDEVTMLCNDGASLPVMASLNSFSAVDGSGVCLIASDLTERKQVEEANRLDALRAERQSEFSRSLVEASLDEPAILNMATRFASHMIGGASVIRLLSADKQTFGINAHFHPALQVNDLLGKVLCSAALPAREGYSGRVLQTSEALILNTIDSTYVRRMMNAEFPGWARFLKISSLLVVPLLTHDQMIGTLTILRLAGEQPFEHQDLNMAQRIADQTGLAIGNARLYNDLQQGLRREQTMRQQLNQAEKLSALSRMMATVVHEINNPVQTIKNCIYLAKLDTPANSSIEESLNMASSEIARIGKLISGLRDIYRPSKESINEPIELSEMLSEVYTLLEHHLQHHNVIWQQNSYDDELWVHATSDHLKQVFLNISLNAVEAMQPDGGTIDITLGTDPDTNEVSVIFKDNGPGIEPEKLDKIFEPFYTTKEGGSGLGLPICYEIMQVHSGRVTVESQPGCGSAFTVWLPKVPPPDLT